METLQDATLYINTKLNSSLDNIILDGDIKRFGDKKSCWYAGNEWSYKGNIYQKINFGSWKLSEQFTWTNYDKKISNDKNFIKAEKKHNEEMQYALQMEKQRENKSCRDKWKPIFDSSVKSDHDYLNYKNVKKYNTRVSKHGALLIPMYDHEKFVGVQQIFKDPENPNDFLKLFSKGVAKKGSFCHLTSFKDAEYIYLSEGYATAASIQEAFPEIPSICAFDAGNLLHAINSIREINNSCKIIIAADLDANYKGEKEAKKCVNYYSDVIYKKPIFPKNSPSDWSDFNDLHNFVSMEEVQKQLVINEDDFFKVEFLGVSSKKNSYFISSTINKQITEFKDSYFNNKSKLFKIAPYSWYCKNYGNESEDGKVTINWTKVVEEFTIKSLEAGFFNKSKVKGTGVWRDKDNFIFNNGTEIYPKINHENLNNFYNEIDAIDKTTKIEKPLSLEEMQKIYQGISKLSLGNNESHAYLAAWMVQANILSIFKKRFHIWITGETSSGKSWIQEELLEKCIYNCIRSKNASAASIYPIVEDNAIPIILDESEPDKNQIKSIVQMARDATDSDGATKQRTNPQQEIITFKSMCTFAMGSIDIMNLQPQDKNRFFFIDVIPRSKSGQTQEDFIEVQNIVDFLQKNKNRFFTRCYNRIPQILENEKIAYKLLKEKNIFKIERTNELVAVMIACLLEYHTEEKLNKEIFEIIIKELDLENNYYINDAKTTASEECYHELMSMNIDAYNHKTLAFCLELIKDKKEINKDEMHGVVRMIQSHGMRYFPENDTLFIASNSKMIKQKLEKFPDYAKTLSRDDKICFENNKQCRVKGFHTHGVKGIFINIIS